jgi:hypothetical protein
MIHVKSGQRHADGIQMAAAQRRKNVYELCGGSDAASGLLRTATRETTLKSRQVKSG